MDDHADPGALLEPYAALIGTWATEGTHPLLPGEVVRGEVTYEWLAGHRFLIQRSHVDHERFPDAIAVTGPPEHGDGLVQEWFDSRGVRRTYATSLTGGELRVWRDDPSFAQRMVATLGGEAFTLVGELARTPGAWEPDLRLAHRRIA